jgi:hypothetical protein
MSPWIWAKLGFRLTHRSWLGSSKTCRL